MPLKKLEDARRRNNAYQRDNLFNINQIQAENNSVESMNRDLKEFEDLAVG